MPKLRIIFGLLSCIMAFAYTIFGVIALDSAGRISSEEFIQITAVFFIITLLIAFWAYLNGDEQDKKDRKNEKPDIF